MSEEKPLMLYRGGVLTVNEHDTHLLVWSSYQLGQMWMLKYPKDNPAY